MIVPQAPLVEVAATRRVRVLGSLEDMAVWALAMDVGVGLGLAMSVDWKKATKARGGSAFDTRQTLIKPLLSRRRNSTGKE